MNDTLPKPRPELAELPRPVAFPDVRTFAELFPVLTSERESHKWQKSEVSNWIQIKSPDGYRHAYAVLPQWLIDWVQANMLPVDYDSIYFTINMRDDVTALVTAQYNQIIGSRWLALIDANSVPDAYESRVRTLEAEGMTRSDAQAVADAENM